MRRGSIVVLGALLVVLPATPAFATAEPVDEDLVVLSGEAVVPVGEVVQTVVVFDGSADIAGHVTDTVVVLHGPVTVSGRVDGEVVVLSGRLVVTDGAAIGGDVYADRRLVSPGASVEGVQRSPADVDWALGWASAITMIAVWFAVAMSVLVLGMALIGLAPRAADATFAAVREAPGSSIGWGTGVFIGLPLLAAAAMGTLVGLPLGIALMLGLALIFAVGQTAGAWFLGRALVAGPSRMVSFLLGWAIVSGLGLVPGLGWLLWVAATVTGLGAISVATWRARRADRPSAAPVPPPMPAGA